VDVPSCSARMSKVESTRQTDGLGAGGRSLESRSRYTNQCAGPNRKKPVAGFQGRAFPGDEQIAGLAGIKHSSRYKNCQTGRETGIFGRWIP
jgi:hypothetical protein